MARPAAGCITLDNSADERHEAADAGASTTYHLDEDDDPDAFVIGFKGIAIEQ
ncbi:hypothetical protein ABZW03_39395 [Kitasatospora sp. NPDC004799]|uniref:hypothetical protein n=1 Tax=Kitasatospora sp. NPDC004799 TaxID=3154460 RepID=UPI0033A00E63